MHSLLLKDEPFLARGPYPIIVLNLRLKELVWDPVFIQSWLIDSTQMNQIHEKCYITLEYEN